MESKLGLNRSNNLGYLIGIYEISRYVKFDGSLDEISLG